MTIITEKNLLYFGIGFFGYLYLMSHFRFLRPANAQALSLSQLNMNKNKILINKE